IRRVAEKQPDLQADESDGLRGTDGAAHDLSRVSRDAARDIQRQHRGGMAAQSPDRIGEATFNVSFKSAAEDRIHQQVGFLIQLPVPLSRGSPGIDEVAVRRRGITSKRIGRNEPAYANAYSLLSRKARQHERSEERRVGKECRSGASQESYK